MTVYGEIVQIKQDRIISVFRFQVIETIVSQYCGHFSSAGVTRYIRFRDPKPWKLSSVARQDHMGRLSLEDTQSRPRLGPRCPMRCFRVEPWTMTATARPGSSASPTERLWVDRQHRDYMGSR
jgi:hypothetical protein